ncbi:MAG TPA: hypothetical protein VKZ81_15010 [Pseudonocardia sp.]|jgi:hypothetical protein|uniref:hypothetical protein n=1 Tax=Pseudonocardia sp. TaxID=60912 RepID=UPI002B4B578F|nr:hypothetical protein [Pseudonocardia sp.]HLU56765.1 hypothetical protein [Pseudonocardia sp.]
MSATTGAAINTVGWIVVVAVVWIAVAAVVGVLVGRIIRARDRQVPPAPDGEAGPDAADRGRQRRP